MRWVMVSHPWMVAVEGGQRQTAREVMTQHQCPLQTDLVSNHE